jgi:hypothetical protein
MKNPSMTGDKLGNFYACTTEMCGVLLVEKALKAVQYDRKYTI